MLTIPQAFNRVTTEFPIFGNGEQHVMEILNRSRTKAERLSVLNQTHMNVMKFLQSEYPEAKQAKCEAFCDLLIDPICENLERL